MEDLQVTEYSAIALLFLLAMVGARLAWKWLENYNRRGDEREKQVKEDRDRDYEDRQRMSDAMVDLIREDIRAKQEIGTAMQALHVEIKTSNGATAAAIKEVCIALTDLSKEHKRSHTEAEKRAVARHKEIVS